jgi:hypothetical protein
MRSIDGASGGEEMARKPAGARRQDAARVIQYPYLTLSAARTMSEELDNRSLGTTVQPDSKFLESFHDRWAGLDAIEETIRGIATSRSDGWRWVAKWIAEEGSQVSNDMETLVFDIALEDLIGPAEVFPCGAT